MLAIVLALLVIPPLWFLLEGSLHTTTVTGAVGDFTWAHYQRLLSDRQFFRSLGNSLIFALGSMVLALCFGGLVAWLVERTNAPFKAFAYLTAIISLGTPFVLYVIAWIFLLGRNGPINDVLLWLGAGRFNVFSMTGMILVEGFLWSPLAFLLLSSVFQAANAEYEEAARMCGAGMLRTVMRISLRLAFPAFMAVALLIVVRSVEAFEVPALVGLPGNVRVLTTNIYLDMKQNVPPDLGYSSAFSMVLLLLAGALIALYARLSRHAARYHTVTGRSFRPRQFDLGRARHLGGAAILLNFFVILLVPTAGLLWLSVMPFTQGISLRGLHLLTLENFRTVVHSTFYLDLVWQTLFMSAGAATGVMALTIVSGWLAVRHRPGAWLLDQLATAPLIFPGIVLGVAMIQIYLATPIAIYGTLWAFIIAFVIRYLPFGMRYSSAGSPANPSRAGRGCCRRRQLARDRATADHRAARHARDPRRLVVCVSHRGARSFDGGDPCLAVGPAGFSRDVRFVGQWAGDRAFRLRPGMDGHHDCDSRRLLSHRTRKRGIRLALVKTDSTNVSDQREKING